MAKTPPLPPSPDLNKATGGGSFSNTARLHRAPFKPGDLSEDLYLNQGLDPDSSINKKMIADRTAGRGPIRPLTKRDYADMERNDQKRPITRKVSGGRR